LNSPAPSSATRMTATEIVQRYPKPGIRFSVLEHPLEPGALAAPPHTHAAVDEYSFVIEGEIGVHMD
jgi:hypothetical protein